MSAAAARRAREEAGRRAYEAEQRARAAAADRAKHDPFGSRVPDHSVVHRYARCLSYPEWGVGTVTGIYFSGEGDDVQQWARMSFAVGVRTVPAGSLQFVDFSKPDPAADRVERFMTAAQHALAEGNAALAAQRLVYARDADPTNPMVLRLLTAAFWQSGNLPAAARAVRDWARVETDRPTPERFASRIYEDMGALDLAADAAARAADRAPARRLGLGAARPAAAAADGPRRARSPRSSRPGSSARRSRACSTSRSPTTSPATSAPRSRPPRPRRDSTPNRPPPGRATPTRSRAPTGSPSASTPAGARWRSATSRRWPSCWRGSRRRSRAGCRSAAPLSAGAGRRQSAGGSVRRSDGPSRPHTGHDSAGASVPPAALGAVLGALEHAEQLADAAHEQPLLVDLDPGAGGSREHDVVAGLDGHRDADVVPPVEARADGEHDPVLRRGLVGARRHEQPRAADPIGVELLDHDAVEQWAKLVAHGV